MLPEEMHAEAKAPKASSSKRAREEETLESESNPEIIEVFPAKKKKTAGKSPIFSDLFQLMFLLLLAAPIITSQARAKAPSSRVGRK